MTTLSKPVRRVTSTRAEKYGPDHKRRLVVTIHPGNGHDVPDRIELRPERRRQGESANVDDIYRWLIKCRVNRTLLEKARQKKQKLADRRLKARIARADRKFSTYDLTPRDPA